MKKLLTTIAICAPLAATAQNLSQTEIDSACANLAGFSGTLMESHQLAVPLSQTLDIIATIEGDALRTLLRDIAIDAYSRPRYRTPDVQNEAIADFETEVHIACLQGYQD